MTLQEITAEVVLNSFIKTANPKDDVEKKCFEVVKEALEKQIPKKPITYQGTHRADCPACGHTVRGIKYPFGVWCSKCGQKLDWSKEDETHNGK